MKTIRQEIIEQSENGDYLIAEIVDDVSEEERKEFEVYELKAEETLSKKQKKELSDLVKRYLKSYSKYKNKLSLEEWLLLIFREDFPDLEEKDIIRLKDKVLKRTEESYKVYNEVKRARKLGITPDEYFATKVENSEEFKKLENKKEILLKLDEELTDDAVDKIYTLSEINVPETSIGIGASVGKTLGQASINTYVGNINKAIDRANANMQDTILRQDGLVSQNPNLDGFIAESHHSNTFNVDAATKELNLRAEDLKPDVYGKNSVDIVIKKCSNGAEEIVRKYQAKFGKDSQATESYFRDETGEYKYHFQKKLVGKDQVEDIPNAVDKIEYGGAESKSISKDEAKEMQEKVQNGETEALDLTFKEDVNTHEVLKRVGYKAVKNTIYSGAIAAGLHLGKKLISGEEINGEEVVETAITTGVTSGVSTAIYGALTTAVEKGILKGVMANSNFISAVAFSAIEAISTVFKIGSGEITFKEGMDNLGEIFTTGMVIAKGMAIVGKAGGIIATLAGMIGAGALATTVASVVAGAVVATVGTVVAKTIYTGAKAVVKGVVSGAKAVVSAGVSVVKTVASCAWEGVKTVASGVWEGAKSVVSGFFSWW